MSLLSSLEQLLTAPASAILDSAVRDLVEEIVASRSFVKQDELTAAREELTAVQKTLVSREADLTALRQSIEAYHLDQEDEDLSDILGIPDVDEAVSRLEDTRDELTRRLERVAGALQATSKQLASIANTADTLSARADQAFQVATTARATAEAAADGVTELEQQLS